MATARNALGSVTAYVESVYGTAPTGVEGLKARLISHSFSETENLVTSPEIRSGRNPAKPYHDGTTISGNIVILADAVDVGYWLKWSLGDLSTTGTDPNYTHAAKVASSLPSLTLELIQSGIARLWRVTGAMVQSVQIDLGTNGMLQLTISFLAKAVARDTLASRIDATPYQSSGDRFKLRGSTIGISADDPPTAIPHISQFSITFDNQIDGYEAIPEAGFHEIHEGVVQVSGNATILIKDSGTDFWSLHSGETEVTVEATLTSEASKTLKFRVPEALVRMAIPSVQSQTGPTLGQLSYQGFLDNAADASAFVAELANAHASYATIPSGS